MHVVRTCVRVTFYYQKYPKNQDARLLYYILYILETMSATLRYHTRKNVVKIDTVDEVHIKKGKKQAKNKNTRNQNTVQIQVGPVVAQYVPVRLNSHAKSQ